MCAAELYMYAFVQYIEHHQYATTYTLNSIHHAVQYCTPTYCNYRAAKEVLLTVCMVTRELAPIDSTV
jgi:hypothetical protein